MIRHFDEFSFYTRASHEEEVRQLVQ